MKLSCAELHDLIVGREFLIDPNAAPDVLGGRVLHGPDDALELVVPLAVHER
jgi:hypothetical protein